MHSKLQKWNTIKQKSNEWYNERNKVITATDVSSILEINPFKSKYEVFQQKRNKTVNITENPATKWGEFHEPLALKYYETLPLINGSKKVWEVGLIHHPIYKWLAASPDGVVESLEKNNKDKWWLLEIKCPYQREFKNKGYKTPSYIWIQIQIQLEVCDLPFCHLLQCKYVLTNNSQQYSHLANHKITTIARDKKWFNDTALPKLLDFWNLMKKSENYDNFANPYPNPLEWVSLNSFTGYLLKDPIIDWLNMYQHHDTVKLILNKKETNNSGYHNKIKKRNNIFKSIIENLTKYGKDNNKTVLYITDIDENWNEDLSVNKYEITKKALEDNIDILIRPVLLDFKRKIYGIPDIIIKTEVALDYLQKCHNNVNGLKYLKSTSSYTVFSLSLKNNFPDKGLLSKWDNILKSKYTGYASIINSIVNNNETIISLIGSNTCILFDPKTIDTYDCIKINEGVQWVKTIRENGERWLDCINLNTVPTNSKLMPNMCNKFDQKWRGVKKELAEKWGELTLLWYCGIDQRNRAHEKGVYSWKARDDMTSEEIVMALYADDEKTNVFSNRKRIINSMISLNQTKNKIYTSRNVGELTEPFLDTENALEVYIDFEVLSGKNINKNHSPRLKTPQDIIYLIGMQWECPKSGDTIFKSFISSSLTLSSEKNMLKEWWDAVKQLKINTNSEKIILYHWSPAEERFLNRAFKRHSLNNIKSNLNSGKYDLRDLMEMFVEAEVVIRNVWGYSVKDIAKGLHKHGLISEVWDDTEKGGDMINTGEGTLATATNCYKEILNTGMTIYNNPNFTPIREYNQMDCNVLQHLLSFLRNYVYSKDPRQLRRNKRKRNTINENLNKKFKKV